MGYRGIVLWAIIWMLSADVYSSVEEESSSFGTNANRTSSIRPEGRLVQYLMAQSSGHVQRPSINPVNINFELIIVQILEFNQKQQKLVTQAWQHADWQDPDLTWDPKDFNGIKTVQIDSSKIWIPDIILYNTYGEPKTHTKQFKLVVNHTGNMLYIPPVILESSCQVDLSNFPFDTQTCVLTFGSWTYSVNEVDIVSTNNSTESVLGQYIPNLEWDLINVKVKREASVFSCCPDSYVLVTYTLNLRRNAGYHVRVILLPVMLLSIMAVFIFCIPVHRPDRTGLGLGLFTSFMLLLLLVVDISPPSAESNLSTYLSACVGIVTSAIIVSIVHIHMSMWKGSVPTGLRKVIHVLQRVLFPLTRVALETSRDIERTSKMAEWSTAVVVFDRLMFVVYLTVLVVCLSLYFPIPK